MCLVASHSCMLQTLVPLPCLMHMLAEDYDNGSPQEYAGISWDLLEVSLQ